MRDSVRPELDMASSRASPIVQQEMLPHQRLEVD